MAWRFNPPPGWPVPPAGWSPPSGWTPDPSWPPLPHGWPLWVDDRASSRTGPITALNWAAGGAALFVLGSFMPMISTPPLVDYQLNREFGGSTTVFGLILLGLTLGMRPVGARVVMAILTLLGAGFLLLGYSGLAIGGMNGFDRTEFGYTQHVEFSPNIGLVTCIAGAGIACISTVLVLASPRRSP